MPKKTQKGSWSYTVERIFGDSCDAFALDTFKGRLKIYCNETYLSKMPKAYVHQTGSSSDMYRGSIRFPEASYPYIENLLLIDSLIGSPKQVMEIMTRHISPSKRLAIFRTICAAKREELKRRLDIELQTVEESKAWERLPEKFDLDTQLLSRFRAPSQQSEKATSASRAARFAAWERMREIDQEESSPENIAEKAFYLVRMGQRELGLKHVEQALNKWPQHSLLHFVKGMAFLDEAQYEQRHAELHTILIDESEPLSGAEYHHQEQADDRAEKAFQSRLTATRALLDAHEYWPNHLPYNWFTNVSPWELQQQVSETILANGLYLAFSGRNFPSKLTTFLSDLSLGKGLTRPLTSPEMFPIFGRCLALAHMLDKTDLRGEFIEIWLQVVESEESKAKGELTISPTYFIRESQPWKNPWPQLIAANVSQKSLADAISEQKGTKFYTAFAEKHIRLNAEHQLQRIFAQLNEQFWLELVQNGANYSEPNTKLGPEFKRRVEVCEKALKHLPWATSGYAEQWQIRWAYASARALFDLAVCNYVDGKVHQASKMMGKVESLAKTYPAIGKKKLTHFVVSYVDDDGQTTDWEHPLDMLGHATSIFDDTKHVSFDPNEGIGLFHPSCFDYDFDSVWYPLEIETPETYAELTEKASKLKGTAVERLKILLGTGSAKK